MRIIIIIAVKNEPKMYSFDNTFIANNNYSWILIIYERTAHEIWPKTRVSLIELNQFRQVDVELGAE